MTSITANDLRTKGISVVESALRQYGEAVITVRGERRYVVLDFNAYSKLRGYELDIALREASSDLESGNCNTESVADHMKRVLD